MKWTQFFTPITSITWQEAIQLAERTGGSGPVFLDVRQPKEYRQAHLPGAKLIPLGELESRMGELDREAPIAIY